MDIQMDYLIRTTLPYYGEINKDKTDLVISAEYNKTELVSHPYDVNKDIPNVSTSRHNHIQNNIELTPMPIVNSDNFFG